VGAPGTRRVPASPAKNAQGHGPRSDFIIRAGGRRHFPLAPHTTPVPHRHWRTALRVSPPYTSASACLPLLPSARPFPSHTSSLRASFLYVSPASQEMPREALLPVSPTAGPSYPQRETALNNIVEGIIRVTQKKWPHNCALPQLHLRTCRCLRRRQGSHHRDHPRGSRRLDRHAAHPAPLARP